MSSWREDPEIQYSSACVIILKIQSGFSRAFAYCKAPNPTSSLFTVLLPNQASEAMQGSLSTYPYKHLAVESAKDQMGSMTETTDTRPRFGLHFLRQSVPISHSKTFWNFLCAHCKTQSIFGTIYHQPFKRQTAWALAGPLKWKWDEELQPVTLEHLTKN